LPWLQILLLLIVGFLLYRQLFNYGVPAVDPRPVTPAGDLAADEKSTIDLFKEASPSVVNVTTLAQRLDLWTRNVLEIPQGTGTGFIWDDAGHIVTNFHVIESIARGGGTAQITLSDHTTYPADLVGIAPDQDLAVLRIRAPRDTIRPIARIGSTSDLQVGQKVFAIGNPFGLDQTLTTGIVSALGRSIPARTGREIEDAIQTDAAINPGNSGGPLFDSSRRLIGVNTAIFSPTGAYAGIGFAVPVDTVNRVVPQLIRNGRVASPDIGVIADDRLGLRLTRRMGVEGVLVLGVRLNSPAAAAGLRGTQRTPRGWIPGDVITHVDDRKVNVSDDLQAALERHDPGDTVTLTILRDGKTLQASVKLPAE
jgi:S1-C subfamily serine protease